MYLPVLNELNTVEPQQEFYKITENNFVSLFEDDPKSCESFVAFISWELGCFLICEME